MPHAVQVLFYNKDKEYIPSLARGCGSENCDSEFGAYDRRNVKYAGKKNIR